MPLVNQEGQIVVHRNMKTDQAMFLKVIQTYRKEMVVAWNASLPWYRLVDLCAREGIPLVLGHAFFMKAIHGGRPKMTRLTLIRSRSSCTAG